MELEGKTVLLTGASGGIGKALATALAGEGARLILTGRSNSTLATLCQQLQQRFPSQLAQPPISVCADLDTAEGRALVVERCASLGVQVVVNNAGYQDFALFEEQAPDSIERTLRVNLLAPMLLINALLPQLRQHPQAAIINIGSTFGSIGHPAFATYCASKFGLRGFTEALRRELADTQIRVHYLAPRGTRTALNTSAVTAMNESLGNAMDDPRVVAQALIDLLRADKSRNRFLGWPEKLFVRINSLLPGVIDNALKKQLATIRHHAAKHGT